MSILSSQSCGTYNANILKERSPYLISTVTGKEEEEEEEEEEASKLYNQIQPFRKDWLTPIAFCFIVAGCQGAIFFSTVKGVNKERKADVPSEWHHPVFLVLYLFHDGFLQKYSYCIFSRDIVV